MKQTKLRRRPLSVREILRWADAYRETTGHWPTRTSGAIPGAVGETWDQVDQALYKGLRTLPGGSSLARLLTENRGARNPARLPPLTEEQVLAWADAHRARTGRWPTVNLGTIPGSGGEKWSAIEGALRKGARGFAGDSSLARFLAERRAARNRSALAALTEEQILTWADAHYEQTGHWPSRHSGPIREASGETWIAADGALRRGTRSLPGGSSLALLLADKRGVRNAWGLPPLSVDQILAWADLHHQRTGGWPTQNSGHVEDSPDENWSAINHALAQGYRGLPGGYSLAELLGVERDVRTRAMLPRLRPRQILAWASSHHRRAGRWPTQYSGAIQEAPTETWHAVDLSLRHGLRGLRSGSSLCRLLAEHSKKHNHKDLPRLSQRKVLAWADAYHCRIGKWPNVNSGPVAEAPQERWDVVDNALRQGGRGLRGGSSLARLLAKKRGARNHMARPPLTEEQILAWADAHYRRTSVWPKRDSGVIADASGETWGGIQAALWLGHRGLPGGRTLAQLLRQRRAESRAEPKPIG